MIFKENVYRDIVISHPSSGIYFNGSGGFLHPEMTGEVPLGLLSTLDLYKPFYVETLWGERVRFA